MADEELEELVVRDDKNNMKEILDSREDRQALCESFMEEHKIKGIIRTNQTNMCMTAKAVCVCRPSYNS